MIRRPPRSTRTDTLFPYTTLFRSIGFRNGEDLGSATDGTLTFTSTADEFSGIGNYAINGGGLTSTNYVFVQDPGNATALTIEPATLTFIARSEARRVGTECVSACRSRCASYPLNKNH